MFSIDSLITIPKNTETRQHITVRESRWTARTNAKAQENPADVDLNTNKQLQKLFWTVCLISQQMSTSLADGIITMGLKISGSRKGRI